MIIVIVGTRPNFMKMSPIIDQLLVNKITHKIVHTGQHYDKNMSTNIMADLNFKKPDYFLNASGGTFAEQTSKIVLELEKICKNLKPSLALVAGDVNSSLSSSIVFNNMKIPIGHVEAGLRSFDKEMPEENNRILIDHISDLLFVTEPSAIQNLKNENIKSDKVHFVGNCMIDSLKKILPAAIERKVWQTYNVKENNYFLTTFHRPSNVDQKKSLENLGILLNELSSIKPTIFPIHPRTRYKIKEYNIKLSKNIILIEPQSYLDFVSLMSNSKAVITDSGGIQEETTFLNVPCITFRKNTERPITCEVGTNVIVGNDIKKAINEVLKIDTRIIEQIIQPKLWDGESSKRVIKIIKSFLKK